MAKQFTNVQYQFFQIWLLQFKKIYEVVRNISKEISPDSIESIQYTDQNYLVRLVRCNSKMFIIKSIKRGFSKSKKCLTAIQRSSQKNCIRFKSS